MTFDYERFMAWVAARARELRHRAAAFGEPVEYTYLRQYQVLIASFQRDFPGCTPSMVDSSEVLLYGDSVALSLDEINRIRVQNGHPPIDFVPEVVERVPRTEPRPRVPPTPDDQEQRFYKWAEERIITAHHAAAARNTSVSSELFACPWEEVARIQRNFPALNPAWCLQYLALAQPLVRPAALDPERVNALRTWTDSVAEVGSEIEKMASGRGGPAGFTQ